jgi:predicted DCC family thiol-disulfide oxidoreductase YuxK
MSSFRTASNRGLSVFDRDALGRRIHVRRADGRLAAGFEAVAQILVRVVPLWPLLPICTVLRIVGLGDRAYDFVAIRRFHLLPRSRCTGACVPAAAFERRPPSSDDL